MIPVEADNRHSTDWWDLRAWCRVLGDGSAGGVDDDPTSIAVGGPHLPRHSITICPPKCSETLLVRYRAKALLILELSPETIRHRQIFAAVPANVRPDALNAVFLHHHQQRSQRTTRASVSTLLSLTNLVTVICFDCLDR